MANMIEHSNFVSMHQMKQEWEDDIVAEDEEKTKMGLIKKCMNCHTEVSKCSCHLQKKTYWGY